ncbi:hypothetical protein LX32DRAFT_501522, partial [Colletotrichum zoysiae]
LAQHLPAYMIPSMYIPLARMPENMSRKLDRRRLHKVVETMEDEELAMYGLTGARKEQYELNTDMERRMRDMWSYILGIKAAAIGAEDGFFQLGGDSVAAMRLVTACHDQGLTLTVADLFQSPRLSEVARLVKTADNNGADDLHVKPFTLWDEPRETRNERLEEIAALCRTPIDRIEDIYPCSPLQEGLMALTMRQSQAYVGRAVFRLHENIDLPRFKSAWQNVSNANPILRTRIIPGIAAGATSLQVVVREDIEWEEAEDVETCLDGSGGMTYGEPLLRFTIVNSGTTSKSLVWAIHHALYDGWSKRILLRQLEEWYHGSSIPDPVPFTHFIRQISLDNDQDMSSSFWTKQLRGVRAPAFPALPSTTYQPRPNARLQRVVPLPLPSRATGSEGSGVPSSVVLRAAWAVVLAAYSASDDTAFAVTLSGRNIAVPGLNIADMAAPTMTTVPVRVLLDRHQTVNEYLWAMMQQSAAMVPYEHAGLQNIRRMLLRDGEADADAARTPMQLNNLFMVRLPKEQAHEMPSILTEEPRDGQIVEDFGSYALILSCGIEGDGTMDVEMGYDKTVVSEDMAEMLLGHFSHVVSMLANDAHAQLSVGDVASAGPQDIRQIQQWNQHTHTNGHPHPKEVKKLRCIHQLVEAQAVINPDALAVQSWDQDQDLTYAELDALSTALATYLGHRGVTEGAKVALCFERLAWAIVPQLAVLKVGGVCVPLTPDQWSDAISGRAILEQVKPILCLTNRSYQTMLAKLNCQALSIDAGLIGELMKRSTNGHGTNGTNGHRSESSSETTAFMLYNTSDNEAETADGIVSLSHEALITTCQAYGEVLGLSKGSRVAHLVPYASAQGIHDTFATLLSGGCICVLSEKECADDAAGSIGRSGATIACLDHPSLSAMTALPEHAPSLRSLVVHSSKLTTGLWSRNRDAMKQWGEDMRMLEVYGTVRGRGPMAYRRLHSDTEQEQSLGWLAISRASLFWVVDPRDHDKLQPVGSIGELLIESTFVEASATTTDRPWQPRWASQLDWSGKQGTYHKTGELVRYNADGSLTSVGSKDEHIQILSHRAEVEARLLERIKGYESVAVEVVVPLKGVKKPTVMAFLVEKETPQSNGTNGHSSTLANGHQKNGTTNGTTKPGPVIRASLADAIPSHMTPTVYVPLARMPRTSKGEVDRQRLRDIAKSIDERQLAAYGDTGASSRATKLEPSTDLEKHLQSLWSRILGVEGTLIGASDSFFQLGGDSVAAMKLVALARREQVVTTVASIFEHPILGDLAVVIEQEEAARIGGANSEIAADEETIAPFALWDEVDDMSVESRSERVAQVAAQCQILPEQIEDIYPCTPLQEGMMAITMRQPRAYIGRVAFRILETVDVARFKAAWDRLVAENPILRTRIVPGPSAGPQSLQVVVKEGVQWRTSTSVDAYRLEDDRTTMSLGGPLARYGMVESRSSGRDKAVFFVWTVHHALFDGWSRQTLLSQLQHLYMHDELAAPVVPYNRFMRYLSRSPFEEADAFWKDQLQGNVPRSYPALPSPAYLPRPNVKIQAFVRMDMNNAKIGGWDMPLSVMLRAAWAVVMATYSGSDDVIFASTLSGRSAPVAGISDITGPTMTTVPIRITIDRQGSALDFVRAVNEQATRMIAFEQTGLQNIRRLVGKADDGLGLGLTTNFLVQPPEAESQESALMVSERDGAATLDFESYLLILECCVESTGVTLKVQYDDNVLNVKRVESYLSQYQHVLAQLITSAGQQQTEPVVPVGSLFSASPRDMERLLEWNKEVPPALEECIHQIVQNQADLQPDAPAICSPDRNLTYRELDELAAKLASQLVDLGVAAEVNVPLCLEKSPWAIVAELAVLKAGGVCVPLDPARPAVQNEAILRNVRPVIILASPQHEELFCNSSCNVLPIDDTLQRELQNAQPFRRRVATPGNNAFIIHTSGSTGVPKGVVLQHKALATSCRAHGEAFGLGPQSRVVQFAAYTFDASIQDIFTTLQQGGCVCVISDHERMNNLSAGINRTQANFANLTSTVAALLRPDHVPTLKTIILAGEPVRPEVVALWGNRRDVRLLNSYGPSECSINSSCSPPIEDAARASNIGGPLANLFWVVDPTDSDRLCPLGAVGELLIEGPILARGYLHDEAKTRSSFIYDPAWIRQYGLGAGRRMFKTGDLVRYNDDRGSLTYIGRKDTQVKIRGQRVEMSEIQHQLHRLVPTAKTVAVELIHHPSHPERHILAAFVALEDTADQDRENGDEAIANGARALSLTDSLRRRFSEVYGALGSVLPHYMVPSVYVPVNKMPENAS